MSRRRQPRRSAPVQRLSQGLMSIPIERYCAELERLVWQQMDRKLRRLVDPEDLIQEAFLRFLREADGTKPVSEADVRVYLRRLVREEILNSQYRYFHTQKRRADAQGHSGDTAAKAVSREPDPAAAVAAKDAWDCCRKRQPLFARMVLHLKEDGWTNRQIAKETGRDERTIRKIVGQFLKEYSER
jgi:RNA polymerase sigma factor (sigma-70 family)